MSIQIKAARLLTKLYQMRKLDYIDMTVEDIINKATEQEIDFYYSIICRPLYQGRALNG